MAKDERGTNGRLGPFVLGPCHDELGPGLGRLYEAWQEDTGEPVLLLRPDPQVDWSPSGPMKVQVFFNPDVSTVTVKVEATSAPPDLSDVANLLVMTTASVTRVEDDPQVRAHVASRPRPGGRTSSPLVRRQPRFGLALTRRHLGGLALAGLAALVLGVWLRRSPEPSSSEILWAERTTETPGTKPAWTLGSSEDLGAGSIAYSMPSKPFSNQAIPPCYPQLDESEINGGCWFTVERRPPCLKDIQAEYQGKCYLPISSDRRKKPGRAVEP